MAKPPSRKNQSDPSNLPTQVTTLPYNNMVYFRFVKPFAGYSWETVLAEKNERITTNKK